MPKNFTKFAFIDSVKAAQTRYGSREIYERVEQSGDKCMLTAREIGFIMTRDSFYIATVGENGWPYAQFRGGPRGFLKVLDSTTLGMADFRGNYQYISVGNINATKRACLFLMDYPSQSRLKIWAEAEVVNAADDPELFEELRPSDYDAVIERLITYRVMAFDWNCTQYITPRYTADEIKAGVAQGYEPIVTSCRPGDEEG